MPEPSQACGIARSDRQRFKTGLTDTSHPMISWFPFRICHPRGGCDLAFLTEQAGERTHLGHYTGTGATCGVNLQAPIFVPPFNPGGGPPPYLVAEFTIHHVCTAAKWGPARGLRGSYPRPEPTLRSGWFHWPGNHRRRHGPRFQGAVGWFDVLGVRGEVTYDGQIVFGG